MSRQGDREASNALVASTGFYAGALARAHVETEQHEQTIAVLRADKKARDEELHRERVEKTNLATEVERLTEKVKDHEMIARIEKNKVAEAAREITHLKERVAKHDESLATLNRALVESHHERDGLRAKLHQSGEAVGWLKGTGDAFLASLRTTLVASGYTCEKPADVLEAVRDLAERAGPLQRKTQKLLPKG